MTGQPRLLTPTIVVLLPATLAAQQPAPEEQRSTLDGAREIALNYVSTLPDFICTEQVERMNNVGIRQPGITAK